LYPASSLKSSDPTRKYFIRLKILARNGHCSLLAPRSLCDEEKKFHGFDFSEVDDDEEEEVEEGETFDSFHPFLI
jgi:hypothetical protein